MALRVEAGNSSPALADVDGDGALEVVVGGMNRVVYALAAEPGRMAWAFETGGAVTAPAAVGTWTGMGWWTRWWGRGTARCALSGVGGRLWERHTHGRVFARLVVIDGTAVVWAADRGRWLPPLRRWT